MNGRGRHIINNLGECPFLIVAELPPLHTEPHPEATNTTPLTLSLPAPPSAETPSSDSAPSGGEGVPSLSQPTQAGEENSNGSLVVSGVPEPPDLADKSSQSSMASLEDAGLSSGGGGGDGFDFCFGFHFYCFVPINEAAGSQSGVTAPTLAHSHISSEQ